MHFAMLVDSNTFEEHDLKEQIWQDFFAKDYAAGREKLLHFEAVCNRGSMINQRTILWFQTVLNPQLYTKSEIVDRLVHALRVTIPEYRLYSAPKVLSWDEIMILNDIAYYGGLNGDQEAAIKMLMTISHRIEKMHFSKDESLRCKPYVLTYLSYLLLKEGRYDECIMYCQKGISMMQFQCYFRPLENLLYYQASAYILRGLKGDAEKSKRVLEKLHGVALLQGQQEIAEGTRNFYPDMFGEHI